MLNSNSSAAIEQNGLLAAAFLSELSDLMKKYNAVMTLERCWDNEYESHAELDFEVGNIYVMGNFHGSPIEKIDADKIMKLSQSCG